MTHPTDSACADYSRVAEAIRFLQAQRMQQPGLEDLAAHLDLSVAHVQKLFSRWAGLSPKRFLQFLNVEYAKRCMQESGDLLSVAHDAGLSGSGRLHDLFVNMEAMSPGEFKCAAAGITIRYGIQTTPFGNALIANTSRGICHLAFSQSAQPQTALAELQARWPAARFEHHPRESAALLESIFDTGRQRRERPLSLWVSGTNFQIQVWRALLGIPFSYLLSYRQVAESLGRPRSARAVGNAVAGNPVAYLIPCHRVLQSSGDFGKYRWGEARKAALIAWEAAQAETGGRRTG